MAIGPDEVRKLADAKAKRPWEKHADEIDRIEKNVDRAVRDGEFESRTVGPNDVVTVKMDQSMVLRSQTDIRKLIEAEVIRRFRTVGHEEVTVDWDADTMSFFNRTKVDLRA